ncbi:MAG: GRAS family protein [Caldilineaceae bacterium]
MNNTLFQLLQAAQAIERGEFGHATTQLDAIARRNQEQPTAADRLNLIFAQALRARITGDTAGVGNLYQTDFTASEHDMISAFGVLVATTPLIRFGYTYANQALVNLLQQEERIHLIDIGITPGVQWRYFLERLAAVAPKAPHVRLTGIDVPFSTADPEKRLRQVGAMLGAHAAQLGIPFTYQPIASYVEQLDFGRIALDKRETLAVNATLALHHTPASDGVVQAEQSRDAVLQRIFALQPRILTLIEPDSEHNALPFVQRVQEAYHHYLAVFEALETILPATSREKSVLENAFFGREVINVIAAEGAQRVERHERSAAWQRRLQATGFRQLPFSSYAVQQEKHTLPLPHPFRLWLEQGMVRMGFRQTPLVSASAWCTA